MKVISHQFSAEFHVYELDNQLLKTLPASDVWSSAMYFRLVALDYLSKDYDVALYLDADVICDGQLDLAANLIEDKVCGVIADDIGVRTKSETRLHTPQLSETYFNSGVMFVNLRSGTKNELLCNVLSCCLQKMRNNGLNTLIKMY